MLWLEDYSSSHGDPQPHQAAVHLPSSMRKNDVYTDYKRAMQHLGREPVTLVRLTNSPACCNFELT